ncbi:hypothetical protein [Nonomuraea typhae]|uniref:HK97 gp10 family phage protein n=1 Tax=Nonomuraea typhae TaxID=2603600 RepID=A0ABW7ZD87_9ACTN
MILAKVTGEPADKVISRDLTRFYRQLFTGKLIGSAAFAEMLKTVDVRDENGKVVGHYGLGINPLDTSCGRFWGHDGGVFGMETVARTSLDGRRQVAYGTNHKAYQRPGPDGELLPHPIDAELGKHVEQALCGTAD